MPVFFYIDPEFLNDPSLDTCNSITLAYTFFKSANQDEVRPEEIAAAAAEAAAEAAGNAAKPAVAASG